MWEFVLGGATVFGSIVALAAWLNGRATRRFLAELISRESQATRELIREIGDHLERILEQHSRALDGIRQILERMDFRLARIESSTE